MKSQDSLDTLSCVFFLLVSSCLDNRDVGLLVQRQSLSCPVGLECLSVVVRGISDWITEVRKEGNGNGLSLVSRVHRSCLLSRWFRFFMSTHDHDPDMRLSQQDICVFLYSSLYFFYSFYLVMMSVILTSSSIISFRKTRQGTNSFVPQTDLNNNVLE